MSRNVSIAVCGKFHMLNYLPVLVARGAVSRFYMSHKKGTVRALELPTSIVRNFPAKEYLIQGHGRLPFKLGYEPATVLYQAIWEQQVLNDWVPSDVLHLLAQGAAGRLAQRAISEGSAVLCEVVNTHPENRLRLMKQEAEHWGVKWRRSLLRREDKLIEEVGQAHALLAPSQHVANSFRDRGVSAPIHVIPYAANIDRFVKPADRDRVSQGGPLKIIAVGQIGLRKGQLRLLQMLDRFGKSVEITLVGSIDPVVAPLLARYQGRFTHRQRVPNVEMPRLLSQHHVFVSTSLEEGLAVSICEAMAMGLCVIATRESGAEEVMVNSETGLIVDACDQAALENALGRILDQRELADTLGAAAHQRTQTFVNWKSYAERLQALHNAF